MTGTWRAVGRMVEIAQDRRPPCRCVVGEDGGLGRVGLQSPRSPASSAVSCRGADERGAFAFDFCQVADCCRPLLWEQPVWWAMGQWWMQAPGLAAGIKTGLHDRKRFHTEDCLRTWRLDGTVFRRSWLLPLGYGSSFGWPAAAVATTCRCRWLKRPPTGSTRSNWWRYSTRSTWRPCRGCSRRTWPLWTKNAGA